MGCNNSLDASVFLSWLCSLTDTFQANISVLWIVYKTFKVHNLKFYGSFLAKQENGYSWWSEEMSSLEILLQGSARISVKLRWPNSWSDGLFQTDFKKSNWCIIVVVKKILTKIMKILKILLLLVILCI